MYTAVFYFASGHCTENSKKTRENTQKTQNKQKWSYIRKTNNTILNVNYEN